MRTRGLKSYLYLREMPIPRHLEEVADGGIGVPPSGDSGVERLVVGVGGKRCKGCE